MSSDDSQFIELLGAYVGGIGLLVVITWILWTIARDLPAQTKAADARLARAFAQLRARFTVWHEARSARARREYEAALKELRKSDSSEP
jgi:hypothetical protein